jgi:outer membrane protein assembly factor BamB
MKKMTMLMLFALTCFALFAQKTITFNGTEVEVSGDLITTLHKTHDGKPTGTKELYSHIDKLWKIYTCTEINYGVDGKIEAIYKYNVNLENIDKARCYATEINTGGYKEKEMFSAKIGMKAGASVAVQALIGSDTDWSYSLEPITQVFCTNRQEAEKIVAEILKD